MNLSWHWNRLRRMEPAEIILRVRDAVLRRLWRHQRFSSRKVDRLANSSFQSVKLPALDRKELPASAVDRLIKTADALLAGRWRVFDRQHPCLGDYPYLFVDARSGRRMPSYRLAFDISYRDETASGNIKYIWEPSRHHHLTVLAAAYAVTGDNRYAERVALHLQSWWSRNPFLFGPHWISGIELGVRLISWVWTRRLLDGWPKAAGLFEDNPRFLDQLYYHQHWLASFPSRASSANNHLIAELAGRFAASCAFPLFAESERWRRQSAAALETEVVRQTFASGLNRELATDYHGFVLELILAAAIEGELSRSPLSAAVWERIRAMIDAIASVVDCKCQPPRQGDSDDASGLLLDDPDYNRWNALLSTGRKLFGSLPWWPEFGDEDIRTILWTRGIAPPQIDAPRASNRINLFEDAGQVFLRSGSGGEEIWCRCDHGPHGFLSIAGHAHADALSVELRVGGVQLLAEPGTYCYHSDPKWRSYFRSTIAHNTLELFGSDQSMSGGPFLWTEHAEARLISVDGLDEKSSLARWEAEHSGYLKRGGPVHRRTALLDRQQRILTIEDDLIGGDETRIPTRMAFHFGPDVTCRLIQEKAHLLWSGGEAELELPANLNWTLHRGEEDPPFGWFSPSFDRRVPSFSLLGVGTTATGSRLISRLSIRPR